VLAVLNITKYQLNNSGLTIFTNMNKKVQNTLATESKNSSNFEKTDIDNCAIVIDNKSGAVLAHYSSLPYEISRQVGSTLKPIIVYAPAIENKIITLATPIVDEKIDFGGYAPQNFGDKYYGLTTPREAIKKSMNTVAVKVMSYLGTQKSFDYAGRFGINLSPEDNNLSLALGATKNGINPLSLAAAYATLANAGRKVTPHYVFAIADKGTKIYSQPVAYDLVVAADTAYLVTDCLVDTAKDGTAKGLSSLPFEVAAKTGTAQNNSGKNTDALNVGYTEQGGGHPTKHAANIWRTMYATPPTAFEKPQSIVAGSYDTYSTAKDKILTLASKNTPKKYCKTELFSLSNLPKTISTRFENISAPEFSILQKGSNILLSTNFEEIYDYEITRNDALGKKIIKTFSGAEMQKLHTNSIFPLWDKPISIGDSISYTVTAILRLDEESTSSSGAIFGQEQRKSCTKSIFLDLHKY
ncbi:MAG: penicillin-binding transpeptidase domain-containing protein, partial [Clostridia bacterium]